MSRQVNLIVLHCSASGAIGQRMAHIRAWHTKPPPAGRGWKDVGYHYFIGFDGLLEEGRDLDTPGAHAQGHNANSIGICLAGGALRDFQPKQFDSLKLLLKVLKKAYPDARLIGHNEVDKAGKTCPIFDVQPLKEWFAQV